MKDAPRDPLTISWRAMDRGMDPDAAPMGFALDLDTGRVVPILPGSLPSGPHDEPIPKRDGQIVAEWMEEFARRRPDDATRGQLLATLNGPGFRTRFMQALGPDERLRRRWDSYYAARSLELIHAWLEGHGVEYHIADYPSPYLEVTDVGATTYSDETRDLVLLVADKLVARYGPDDLIRRLSDADLAVELGPWASLAAPETLEGLDPAKAEALVMGLIGDGWLDVHHERVASGEIIPLVAHTAKGYRHLMTLWLDAMTDRLAATVVGDDAEPFISVAEAVHPAVKHRFVETLAPSLEARGHAVLDRWIEREPPATRDHLRELLATTEATARDAEE